MARRGTPGDDAVIVERAPAKINLALHVRRRRADGYHEIETLFAFCRDGDAIRIDRAPQDSFRIEGPFAAALSADGDNLVTAAATSFRAAFGIDQPHAIVLDKHLPIASGIGGGSADAAATLRGLARLHDIPLDDDRLVAIATALGADIPACLRGETVLGTGRGDALVAVDGLAGTPVLLVNPRVAVSTASVFGAWDGVDRGPIPGGTLLDRARAGRNDLAPPARRLAPVIDAVLAMLESGEGVTIARMSGSGATCFALFQDDAARDALAHRASAEGWWILSTWLS